MPCFASTSFNSLYKVCFLRPECTRTAKSRIWFQYHLSSDVSLFMYWKTLDRQIKYSLCCAVDSEGKCSRRKTDFISSVGQQKACNNNINVTLWESDGQAKTRLIRGRENWQVERERMAQRRADGWKVKVGKWEIRGTGEGDLCSHVLIRPLIPYCVDRWVQLALRCGFAKRGSQRTSHARLQLWAWGSAWRTTTDREQCVPVRAPREMLLFGHDSMALWDFQNLPNRRQ